MEDPKGYVDQFVETIKKEGGELLRDPKNSTFSATFEVFTSHNPEEKFSYHVITQNCFTKGIDRVKKWVLDLKSRISQQYSEYPEYVVAMDEAVYSDVQSFRLFGCCKMGTRRFKEGSCSFNDSLLVIREENGSKAGRYIEYEGTQTTKTKKKKSDRSTSTGPTTTTTSFLPGFENCIGFESIRTWVREQKLEIDGSVQNKILALKNPSGYMCPIHQRIHENEKPYIYVNKGNYMFNCRRIQEHEGLSPFVIGRVLDELAVIEQDLDDMSIPTPFSRPIQSGSQGSNDQVARNSPHVFDGLDQDIPSESGENISMSSSQTFRPTC
jgi:hypothetical protein